MTSVQAISFNYCRLSIERKWLDNSRGNGISKWIKVFTARKSDTQVLETREDET